MRIILLFVSLLAACQSMAGSDTDHENSGSVSTSVNATSQEGFDCASSKGEAYLLSEVPVFFSSEFAEAGLLEEEHVGQYTLALVIDENSNIIGYQAGEGTDESSLLVQTILNNGSLPALSESTSCIAGKPFIFEFTIE